MDEQLFKELEQSVKEATALLRGDGEAGRVTFLDEPDPRVIRENLDLSQEDFAALLGISVRTLQNWEQGRRDPTGPAMQLLRIAEKDPEALLAVLAEPA